MKIKKFNETYDYNKLNFIDADSIGVIEFGSITIEIGGEDIFLSYEERSDGDFKILLDDLEQKPLLEPLSLEYDNDEITAPNEFLNDCYEYYGRNTGGRM